MLVRFIFFYFCIFYFLLNPISAQETDSSPEKESQPNQQKPAATGLTLPHVIDYQGFLTNASGSPVSGAVNITFSIWDAATGGSVLWTEEQSLKPHQGYFTAELGCSSFLPDQLFNGESRYLQLTVNGEPMTPRKHINSVAYALFSADAGALNGHPGSEFYTRDQANYYENNEIDAANLGGNPAISYMTTAQLEAHYIKRGAANSVTGKMIANGSIMPEDLGFSMPGTISNVIAGDGLSASGKLPEVELSLSPDYLSGQAYDSRFVKKGEPRTITSSMLVDETITSADVKDGTLQPSDMAFSIGTINGVIAGEGLDGGGSSGSVSLALTNAYSTGSAYDNRFVNVNEGNAINSYMIRNNEISSADIKNGSIMPEDMGFAAGDVTAVVAGNGLAGGGQSGDLTISLAPSYLSGSAYDSRFISSAQIGSVNSDMIANGTILPEDLSFAAGDITSVLSRNGIAGGGITGDLTLELETAYLNGSAYDGVFVNEYQTESITSVMIADRAVNSQDINYGAIKGEHLDAGFAVSQNQDDTAVITSINNSITSRSSGIEGRGQHGVRGIGTNIGVYGEGQVYGVYAKSTNNNDYALYVDGTAHCTTGSWGDVAEFVPSKEQLQPGDVVIIDPDSPNHIKKCTMANDTRVAGIISTSPTLTVGERKNGEGRFPLVLTGIVPCNVIATQPVQPGDLLTTSDKPGFAMKAEHPEIGTVLGKAMEPLTNGSGQIKVLVTLK